MGFINQTSSLLDTKYKMKSFLDNISDTAKTLPYTCSKRLDLDFYVFHNDSYEIY